MGLVWTLDDNPLCKPLRWMPHTRASTQHSDNVERKLMTTPAMAIFWCSLPTSVIKTHSAALQEHTTQHNANVHLLTSVGILQKSYCNACAFVTPRAGWLCVFTQICIGGHFGHHNMYYMMSLRHEVCGAWKLGFVVVHSITRKKGLVTQ